MGFTLKRFLFQCYRERARVMVFNGSDFTGRYAIESDLKQWLTSNLSIDLTSSWKAGTIEVNGGFEDVVRAIK